MRHRRARAAAGDKGLGRLAELGRRHQHHVEGDLAEAAGEQGQHLHGLGDAVAGDVPGDRRVAEAELAGELGAALDRAVALPERGEGAGRTAELGHQHARAQLREALGVAVEGGEPDRRLVAEGHRQRVLQMGAPGHRRVAVAAREVGEMAAHRREVGLDQREPGADLQHQGGIHDVLRRRPPMQPAPGGAGMLGELAHQRQDRVADDLALAFEAGEVDRFGLGGGARDRRRGLGRDDAEPGLGAGERRLDLGAARDKSMVAKHRAHRRGPEHVGEDRRIEDADRHEPDSILSKW